MSRPSTSRVSNNGGAFFLPTCRAAALCSPAASRENPRRAFRVSSRLCAALETRASSTQACARDRCAGPADCVVVQFLWRQRRQRLEFHQPRFRFRQPSATRSTRHAGRSLHHHSDCHVWQPQPYDQCHAEGQLVARASACALVDLRRRAIRPRFARTSFSQSECDMSRASPSLTWR